MKLNYIKLLNYRSCINLKVDFCNDYTVFIGPNGSGKSNIMNGIMALKRSIRTNNFNRRNVNDFVNKSTIEASINIDSKEILYKTKLSISLNERNIDDFVQVRHYWNFKSILNEKKWVEIPEDVIRLLFRDDKRFNLSLRNSLFKEYTLSPDNEKAIKEIIKDTYNLFDSISYYGSNQFADPSKCPLYLENEDDKIIRRPGNIYSRDHYSFLMELFDLYKNNKEAYSSFIDLIGKKGIKIIDKIKFIETKLPSFHFNVSSGGKFNTKAVKRKLIIPQVIIGNKSFTFNQLSDGTFRILALLFYIYNDPCKVMIIEEPEISIHYGLISSFMEIVKSFSKEKQIILTTHSDLILNKVKPENVSLVTNTGLEGTKSEIISKSLSINEFKALKNYLAESGNLGEYWIESGFKK